MKSVKKEESTINQRIKILVDAFEKGNKLAFSKRVGMSNQALGEIVGDKGSNPSFVNLGKIAAALPEVRTSWLLLGEGEMLKSETPLKNNSVSSHATTLADHAAAVTEPGLSPALRPVGNRSRINYTAAAEPAAPYAAPVGTDLIQAVAAHDEQLARHEAELAQLRQAVAQLQQAEP